MIRFADTGDLEAVRRLWDTCFPDEGGFNDWFFENRYAPRHTLLFTDEGVICAMLQMLPYRLRFGARTGDATYIYGACTDPAFRRRGLMARLLEHSFALDREAGRVCSMLIPAEEWLFDFYRPFGYEPAFFADKRRVERQAVSALLPRRLTGADIPAMDALYARSAGELAVLRDDAFWRMQLSLFDALGAGVYGWFGEDGLAAYAFCWADGAQEAVGMRPAYEQGLLQTLGLAALSYTAPGGQTPLGCVKWHIPSPNQTGYFNLMLN